MVFGPSCDRPLSLFLWFLDFLCGFLEFVFSGFLVMISRICASPIFVISIDKFYQFLCIGEFLCHWLVMNTSLGYDIPFYLWKDSCDIFDEWKFIGIIFWCQLFWWHFDVLTLVTVNFKMDFQAVIPRCLFCCLFLRYFEKCDFLIEVATDVAVLITCFKNCFEIKIVFKSFTIYAFKRMRKWFKRFSKIEDYDPFLLLIRLILDLFVWECKLLLL